MRGFAADPALLNVDGEHEQSPAREHQRTGFQGQRITVLGAVALPALGAALAVGSDPPAAEECAERRALSEQTPASLS
ncbi:hypothetical protein RB614_03005 [Phytohabitans sp. ZYX-F-186]|uniref:Uncharacterized protein n=1 Tax=Phytohabitans maris TaxID=3071409 RepID=A0ABU0Z8U4_9ACTN|nr:hypothetical protein [Phytohabitans sp. ZYX-F-186]MDQ7903481.1 hypothetical protein [Phytohabitans sp. ZYX-F-186]